MKCSLPLKLILMMTNLNPSVYSQPTKDVEMPIETLTNAMVSIHGLTCQN